MDFAWNRAGTHNSRAFTQFTVEIEPLGVQSADYSGSMPATFIMSR